MWPAASGSFHLDLSTMTDSNLELRTKTILFLSAASAVQNLKMSNCQLSHSPFTLSFFENSILAIMFWLNVFSAPAVHIPFPSQLWFLLKTSSPLMLPVCAWCMVWGHVLGAAYQGLHLCINWQSPSSSSHHCQELLAEGEEWVFLRSSPTHAGILSGLTFTLKTNKQKNIKSQNEPNQGSKRPVQ